MVNQFKWLQLFAGEGAGASGSGEGAAAATGVENADAGHQRLKELGVPEARIRKNRAYMPKAQEAAKPAAAEPEAPQAAAAQAMGATRLATPVAWLGSTTTGRWLIP